MSGPGRGAPPVRVAGFRLLYLATFVAATGNFAMMSLFPAIARSSGIPDTWRVTVQSVSAGLSIFTTPRWAARSDRIGRRPIILLGMAGFALASLLTAGAIYLASNRLVPVLAGLAALVCARAVFGCFGLASMPAVQAHIADETPPELRASTLATMFSANGLGTVLGPGIAPLLMLPIVGLAGPQLIFAFAGATILVLGAAHLPRKPLPQRPGMAGKRMPGEVLRRRSVWPFVAYMVLLSGCQAANLQMIGFTVIDRTHLAPMAAQPYSGMAMMLGAAAAVGIQLGILRRFRIAPATLMVCGLFGVILGNVLMAFAPTFAAIALAYVVSSAGYGFASPAAAAGASLANPPELQGTVAGMVSAASASGLLAAPVAAMMIYRHSPPAAFLTIAALLLGMMLVLVPRCRPSAGSALIRVPSTAG